MHPRQALPAELSRHAFSVAAGRAAGLSSKRLRSNDLEAPFHGVRATRGSSGTLRALCTAFGERMPQHQHFSHLTAVRLYDLPVPLRLAADSRLHVTAVAPHRAPRAWGVRGYSLSADRARTVGTLRLHDGYRVVSPVDTWCQMAAQLSLDELVTLGDALVRRQRPLATLAQLESVAHSYAGSRGRSAMMQAVRLIRPGTDSPAETRLRLAIVRDELPEPEVNSTIYDDYGLPIARGDLVFRAYKVLAEYDGEHHRLERRQYENDVDRADRLAEANWRTIRFNRSHNALRHTAALASLRRALCARGWSAHA